LLPGLVLFVTSAHAQAPATGAARKVYTNRAAFKLPLRIEEQERLRLKEVRLYVKTGSQGSWTLKETVAPSQTEFIFRAPQEGEYAFCVVTVDKSGKCSPADVALAAPGLIVVVDKQPPDCDLRPVTSLAGVPMLRCDIRDANPDPSKTKLEYRAADMSWKSLQCEQPGLFRVPDPEALHGMVRATVVDLAGNSTTREIPLMANAAPTPAPTAVPAADLGAFPFPPEDRPIKASFPQPNIAAPPRPMTLPDPSNLHVAHETHSDKVSFPPIPDVPGPGRLASEPASAGHTVVNSTRITLNYQIEQEGPSGLGKVEVWMTRDEGQSWQRLCEDPDRRSPVQIELPGEGDYGLTVVVSNGNGTGGTPPAQGDKPDYRLEVDTTKPNAQLLAVRAGNGANAGNFLITWIATDKNLKPEPINLEYGPRPDGPWMPIAKGLRNDGNYRWQGPSDGCNEFYVRLEASDLAGNSTVCVTPQAVVLDRSRPKAHVLGVVVGPN
jgi:hypothetical protein